jgi:ATP-dependent DNA ligase
MIGSMSRTYDGPCVTPIGLQILPGRPYLSFMLQRLFDPCMPTRGTKVPSGPAWIHEIKHDGYRLIVQKEHKRVRQERPRLD